MKKNSKIGFWIARATDDFVHMAGDTLAYYERWGGKCSEVYVKNNSML